MFSIFLRKKFEQSYYALNKDIQAQVFPRGQQEYVGIGMALNTLFKKRDVFQLIQFYASVYTYYKLELGNCAKTYAYAQKKMKGVLSDYECKTLIGLVMLDIMIGIDNVSEPVKEVDEYRKSVISYLDTVEGIQKNRWRFETKAIEAGTINSPLLVDGVRGIHKYIESIKSLGIEKILFEKTSTLYLTDNICNVNYAIDEYTLTKDDGTKIASLWFNIYGTENTDIQPVCFSKKTPFSASEVASEIFEQGMYQLQSIEEICKNMQVQYDRKKLVISTFVYFNIIYIFSFKNIRVSQVSDLKNIYTEKFIQYNKEIFDGLPEKQILDNEQIFKDMLESVDSRVRRSYHENNYILVDDGLSDEYMSEFVFNEESVQKMRHIMSDKMIIDWANIGKKANETYLT